MNLLERAAWLKRWFITRADRRMAIDPKWQPKPGKPPLTAIPTEALTEGQLDAVLLMHLSAEAPWVEFRYHFKDGRNGPMAPDRYRAGAYTPASDGKGGWVTKSGCADFDGGKPRADDDKGDGKNKKHKKPLADPTAEALKTMDALASIGAPAYLEKSKSGNGWHVWTFFDPPLDTASARAFMLAVVPRDAALFDGTPAEPESNRGIEIFPKTSRGGGDDLEYRGNQVWLPFHHAATNGGNRFYSKNVHGELVEVEPELQPVSTEVVQLVLASIPKETRKQAGMPKVAPSPKKKRGAGAHSADYGEAVQRYNSDHPRDYPLRGDQCPVCSSASGFKASGIAGKWACYSTSHPSNVGKPVNGCTVGDALDLDATAAGCTPTELLQREGYLEQPKGSEPRRQEPPHPAEEGSGARPPPGLGVIDGGGQKSNAAPAWVDAETRPLASRSPLSIKRILQRFDLRNQVPCLRGKNIELDTMAGEVTLDRKPLSDVDIAHIVTDVEQVFDDPEGRGAGLQFSVAMVDMAVKQVASDRTYHPIQDYLRSLKWDGVARIDQVCQTTMGIAQPAPITQVLLRRFFIAAVARAMRPGKAYVKSMLVLVGDQHAGKSTWFKNLVPEARFFSDKELDLSKSLDAEAILAKTWIFEWAEMSSIWGRSAEKVKAFISSQANWVVPKYSNKPVEWPRSAIIVGTSNPEEILRDPTGAVRFWPVKVGKLDLEQLASQRDQLWAEALVLFEAGEQWHLTSDEQEMLEEVQKDFEFSTALDIPVLEIAERYGDQPFALHSLLEELGKKNEKKTILDIGQQVVEQVSAALRRNGYDNCVRKYVGTSKMRLWARKGAKSC